MRPLPRSVLSKVEGITLPQHDFKNEDVFGYTENAFWVFDGATPRQKKLTPFVSDAMWFAEVLNYEIKERIDDADSLTELVVEAVGGAEEAFRAVTGLDPTDFEPWQLPSGSLAIVRVLEDRIEAFAIGDAPLYVNISNGDAIEWTGDEKLKSLDALLINAMTEMRFEGKYDEEKVTEMILSIRKKYQATKEGYGTLVPRQDIVVDEIAWGKPLVYDEDVDWDFVSGTVMSDGFYQLVDTYHVFESLGGLSRKVKSSGVLPLLTLLLRLSEDDAEMKQYPRIKKRDDTTVVSFTLWKP